MKSPRIHGFAACALAALVLASWGLPGGLHARSARQEPDIAGAWYGDLEYGGLGLRIVFRISRDEAGALRAVMDSPDQGAKGIPVAGVEFDGDSIRLNVTAVGGRFEGAVLPDSSVIDGSWRQSGMEFPLRLRRGEGELRRVRPQEPAEPYPYEVEEVVFENREDTVTLAGTLTIPRGDGPFPATVLLTGSGQQDRDETVLGHRPFLVLADHLTRAGIAVLRFDDRGMGGSTGRHGESTTEDFARDAAAAVRTLRARGRIDPARVGLAGHSEGAIIAAIAAAADPRIAFIVLLAGPGLPGAEILLEQNRVLLAASGAPDGVLRRRTEQLSREYAVLAEGLGDEETVRRIVAESSPYLEAYTEQEREAFQFSEENIALRAGLLVRPWYRFFMAYDPAAALRKVDCPVLAVAGGKDLQVAPERNLAEIRRALEEGGNRDVTTVLLPGLNHLFQTAATGLPSEYSQIEETFAPAALETVSGWILERFGGEAPR